MFQCVSFRKTAAFEHRVQRSHSSRQLLKYLHSFHYFTLPSFLSRFILHHDIKSDYYPNVEEFLVSRTFGAFSISVKHDRFHVRARR